MTDMTKYLSPQESPVVTAIYAWHESELAAEDAKPRLGRIGGATIGKPCERYIWYSFRKCCRPNFNGRMHRLFETGHLEEPRFIRELRAIGCTVHDVDENGQQFALSAIGGHFAGYLDSAILGVPGAEKTWHVGEYKTHSAKNFAKIKKNGVEKAKPEHYAQMQSYMHLSGMKRSLYLARNKDTDDLYAERFRYDKTYAEALMEKAERIITSNTPPARLSERPDWWQCKYCDAQALCHGVTVSSLPLASVNCRQCCHATPTMDGLAAWTCARHVRGLCVEDQDRACDDHLLLPGLMFGCEPNDDGNNVDGAWWIEFVKEDGELFRHGQGKGEFSTEEMRRLPLSMLSEESFVKHAKDAFGAKVDATSPNDILSRYPEEDCRTAWTGAICDLEDAFKSMFSTAPGEPVAVIKDVECEVAEFEHDSMGRHEDFILIKWLKTNTAEIRIGVM